jgi:hypothetical protein
MSDTVSLVFTSSSDQATDAAIAYGLTFLHPEQAAQLQARLKGVRLRQASVEVDVVTDAGPVRVEARLEMAPG